MLKAFAVLRAKVDMPIWQREAGAATPFHTFATFPTEVFFFIHLNFAISNSTNLLALVVKADNVSRFHCRHLKLLLCQSGGSTKTQRSFDTMS